MPRLVLLTMSLLLILFAAGASAERKVALVVGNSEYRHVNKLPNPVNDADAIAANRRCGRLTTPRC